MSDKKFYKQQSKLDWYNSYNISNEELKIGCLMRIADAVELIANNYKDLIRDAQFYKERYEANLKVNASLRRSNAALRGHLRRRKP